MRARQDLLDHQGVDVDHTVLEQVQRQHADFMVLPAVAGHFVAPREEDEVIGAVPLLDDVQPAVDCVFRRSRPGIPTLIRAPF
jgi:hypothetical protein